MTHISKLVAERILELAGAQLLDFEQTAKRVRDAYHSKNFWLLFLSPGEQTARFACALVEHYDGKPTAALGIVVDRRLTALGIGCLIFASKSYCSRAEITALIRKYAPAFEAPDEEQDILMAGNAAQIQA